MNNKTIQPSALHLIPDDLQERLYAAPRLLTAWNSITPLARNEWICWVESAKLSQTRQRRLDRAVSELTAGKRRPCCWPGCVHRGKKAM